MKSKDFKNLKNVSLTLTASVSVWVLSYQMSEEYSSSSNFLLDSIALCGAYIKTTFATTTRTQSDYAIIVISIIIVILTLYYCVKYLVKPGEHSTEHIKRKILEP